MAEPDFSFLSPADPNPAGNPFRDAPASPFETAGPAADTRPVFEFSSHDNRLLSSLAFRMQVVGVVVVIGGVIMLVPGALALASGGLGGIIFLVIAMAGIYYGVQTSGAAQAFRQIVNSRGNDQTHFIAAVDKLLSVFTIHAVYLVLTFALFGLALLILLVNVR